MPHLHVSWANMARLNNGEQLFAIDGELVTATGRISKKQQDPVSTTPSHALVASTPIAANTYSMHDIAAVGTTIEKIPPSLRNPWTGAFRLLDLDWSARRTILEMLIGKHTVAVFLPGRYGQSAVGIKLPDITKVNKQLRVESLLVAIEESTFEIHSGPGNTKFRNWLANTDLKPLDGKVPTNIKTGFDAVQKLHFPYFSRFPHHLPHITSNNDVNFMLKCDNLQEITINFHFQEVFRKDLPGVEKAAEQLRKEYYLDGVLGLEKLKKLRFSGWCSAEENLGIAALGKWFEGEYNDQQEKGERKSRVEVIWPGKPPPKEEN